MTAKIAVIGAGIAGLSAARKLQELGIDSMVFEAGRWPGGRVCTLKHHGRQFDYGAQYLTPHSRRSAVLFSNWRKAGWIQPWPVLAYELPERKKIDTKSWHVAVPSQAALAERLAEGLNCRCKSTISAITGRPGGYVLETSSGEELGPFEIVLCTLPSEASHQLLAPFPELSNLAAQVSTRPCLATMVTFEEEVMLDFEAAYVSKSPLAWVSREASKPQRSHNECWVLHATDDWSREHINTPTENVASLMLSAFASLCPLELPPISYCRAHRWRHALATSPLALPFCYDDALKIGVAGDWCSGPNVDSAFWSGMDLATAVAASLEPSKI